MNDGERTGVVKAYPKRGGAPMVVCEACLVRWTADGKSVFISQTDFGRHWIIPLPRGKSFPAMPPQGLKASDFPQVPGARSITEAFVFPGVSDSVYAFVADPSKRTFTGFGCPDWI